MSHSLQTWALPAALLAIVSITATWYNLVTSEVPEPYLVGTCANVVDVEILNLLGRIFPHSTGSEVL